MKRINPETGNPFVYGDIRSDGYVFWGYETKNVKKDGHFAEAWRSPKSFAASRAKSTKHKRDHRQTLVGRMLALFHSACHGAKKRGHPVPTISKQHLLDLWEKQQGLCAYTKWPMNLETKSDNLVSIERIDNNIGYTPDNVVLVCWCVNSARNDMAQDKFYDMCASIASNMR